MSISQKDAVYNAVTQVLASNNITLVGAAAQYMTKELRAQVNEILFNSFKAGTVVLDREFTDRALKVYVSGLQSNWLRKDYRLNGKAATNSATSTNDISLNQ